MKMLKNTMAVSAVCFSLALFSQNEIDALRYSQSFPTGTARFTAMGGAFGAIGSDFSVLSSNPAGIAIYRKSEISFSPSIYASSSTSSHYGTEGFGSKTNFNFGNAGLVATFNTGDETGWISSSIGFGYNRINNFNSRFNIEGINSKSSLLDVYKKQIEEGYFNEFGSALAWNAYLVDTLNGEHFTAISKYGETQQKSITKSGSLGETVFSFGGNYNNRFYLGGTVGFSRIRYSEESVYTETVDANDTTTKLNYFSLNENLATSGSGINFKMGMIYRVNDYFRFGGAVHSPTYYDLSDKWDASLNAEFKDTSFNFNSVQGLNDYALVTPFKAIGSMAFLFGKAGLVSFDYEFLDYSLARLSGRGVNNYSYSLENSQINDKYTSASNFKVGTEWKINPFSVRAGYANYGNPFSKGINNKGTYSSYSAGFGIREEGYFIDFVYVLTQMSENYFLYDPAFVDATSLSSYSHSFLVTLGVRF